MKCCKLDFEKDKSQKIKAFEMNMMVASAFIAHKDNIKFTNTTFDNTDGNIVYDKKTGVFSLKSKGTYSINFSINITSSDTKSNLVLALKYNDFYKYIGVNVLPEQVTGNFVIENINDTPMKVSLLNDNEETIIIIARDTDEIVDPFFNGYITISYISK